MSYLRRLWIGGALLLVIVGCGGRSGPVVKGTVTMNGTTPLTQASLEFEGVDPSLGGAGAKTDEEGKFEIRPDPKKAPLKPGKYFVRISKWVDPKTRKPPVVTEDMDFDQLLASGGLINLVPSRYSSRESTDQILTADIKDTDTELKLDVKSK